MSTSDSPKEELETTEANGPVNADYKDHDLDLKTVKKFVIGSFAVTLGVFILMLAVHRMYKSTFTSERGVATAEERQIPGEDQALLQTKPLEDRQEYFDAEEAKLTMTTNAVEHAVIPVESAKKLMIEQEAFPTPEPKEPTAEVAVLSPMVAPPSASEPAADAVSTAAPVAAAPVAAAPASPAEAPAMAMASSAPPMVPKYPNPPDPALVAAGKKIWDVQCMAACHTGKKGAIGPNIHKAWGTMRQLEGGEQILMDEYYVINSMNNPMEHVAKGYMPVMMSFKQSISDEDKKAVAAYLRTQGKEIMVPAPEPVVETPVVTEPVAEPVPAEAAPAPAVPAPEVPAAPAPAAPAPAAPAPAAPAPTPAPAPGPIFV